MKEISGSLVAECRKYLAAWFPERKENLGKFSFVELPCSSAGCEEDGLHHNDKGFQRNDVELLFIQRRSGTLLVI